MDARTRREDEFGLAAVGWVVDQRDRAIRNDHRRAQRDRGAVDAGDGQSVAVDIGVVAQHVDRDRRALGRIDRIVDRVRRIVDRRDRHGDLRIDRGQAVADGVVEVGRAVVVRRRGEQQLLLAAFDDERDSALRAVRSDKGNARATHGERVAVDRADRQHVASIGVGVVGQHVDQDGHVFGCGGDVIAGGRRIADRGDVDRQRVGCRIERTSGVLHREGEACVRRSILIRIRNELQCAGGDLRQRDECTGNHRRAVQLQAAIAWQGVDANRRERVTSIRIAEPEIGHRHGVRRIFGRCLDRVLAGRGIVDRDALQRHRGGVATAATIADRVGEGLRAVEILVRREAELRGSRGVTRHHLKRAVGQLDRWAAERDRRAVDRGDRQLVTIDIDVVGARVEGRHRVFGEADDVVASIRRIVDVVDHDVDRADVRGRAVADGVVELDRAVEQRHRGEGQGAVGVDRDAADLVRCRCGIEQIDRRGGIDRLAVDLGDGQRVAINVAVVAEHRNRDGRSFARRGLVIDRNRPVVDTRDGDGQRGGRSQRAVGDGVGELVDLTLAIVQPLGCSVGLVAVAAVGIERQGPPGANHGLANAGSKPVHCADREAVAFAVGVACGRNTALHNTFGSRADQRGVFVGGVGIRVGDWCVVDTADRHSDGCRIGAAFAVGNVVSEGAGHRALNAWSWRKDELGFAAVGRVVDQRYRAIGHIHRGTQRDRCAVDPGDGQRIAVDVGVVAQHVDLYRRALGGVDRVVDRVRRVVHRRDGHGDLRIDRGQTVADGVVEIGRAVVVRGWREQQLWFPILDDQRDAALCDVAGAGNGHGRPADADWRAVDRDDHQHITGIGIGVVGEHVDDEGYIFRRGGYIVAGGW